MKMNSFQEVKTHLLNQVNKDFDLIHKFEFSINGWNYKSGHCKIKKINQNIFTFDFTYQCEYHSRSEKTTLLVTGTLKHNKDDDTLTTIAIHEISTY